jgi:hypothetical protein
VNDAVSPLTAWENFYVIVGSSAAALTGLQFVVIALGAESRAQSSDREIAAFVTPTIIHFCTVLLISAILSAPWHALSSASLVLGICGAAGVAYALIVVRRAWLLAQRQARRQTGYKPVLEDWLWHAVFPFIAHAALLVAAVVLPHDPAPALFVVAATTLLLLFTGIHNAWDTVTYIAIDRRPPLKDTPPSPKDPPPSPEERSALSS